jgi:hypothetical protein
VAEGTASKAGFFSGFYQAFTEEMNPTLIGGVP